MSLGGSGSLYGMSTHPPHADITPEIVDVDEISAAVVAEVVSMSGLPAFFDRAFDAIGRTVAEQGRTITGPAYARYRGPIGETADLEVGFPTDAPVSPTGEVRAGGLPAATVARAVHVGSYEQLGEAWGRLLQWVGEQGLDPSGDIWEVYVTEPTPYTDPADLHTQLNCILNPDG